MAPSGISINKPAAICIIILVTGGGILYHWGFNPFSSSSKSLESGGDVVNFDQLEKEIIVNELPKAPSTGLESFQVTETTVNVETDGKTVSVFTRQTSPKDKEKGTVVLLHGHKFKSDNWQDIGTLPTLALWGFRAIAIDLPNYGKTKGPAIDQTKTELFMQDLVRALRVSPTQLVLISPSMSGRYSLPYLFSNEAVKSGASPRAWAFVPVAPVSVEAYAPVFDSSQLPTLAVYGSEDKGLGETGVQHFRRMPKAQVAQIPEAGHACYLDKPEEFHNALYHFLSKLSPAAPVASAPAASVA